MSELRIENRSERDLHSYEVTDGYKLNLHLTCFRQGFIPQSVEHHTGIAEVLGSNPVGASEFFLGFICNCSSYFTTARSTFTPNLFLLSKYSNVPLAKDHAKHDPQKVNAFQCDLTRDSLEDNIPGSSVDIVTLVFVLSAIHPDKMLSVLQNIFKVK